MQRFFATTNSASPLKVKPKFLGSLRLKDRNRYSEGGTKFEILNIGFFFACGTLDFGMQDTTQRILNPTNNWNLEFKSPLQ